MTEVGAVLDDDEKIRWADYLVAFYGEDLRMDPQTTQLIIGYDGHKLVFVAGFHHYRESSDGRPLDVELALAVTDRKKITGVCARAVCEYPFVTLGVPRMTAIIAMSNINSMELANRHGWKLEGTKRKAAADGGDIAIYGMLREECIFLKGSTGRRGRR